MNEPVEHKITSLRELPREIAPPRDLWPQLEARLKEEQQGERPTRWLGTRQLAAAAALIVAVAVGIGIGRVWSPPGMPHPIGATPSTAPGLVGASYVSDPRYVSHHEELVRALPAQLAGLPPQSRAKVAASLAAIHQSMQDIQSALGRDPGNALLQELLVNTYQDEMRVLTVVQEAGSADRRI